MKTSEAGEIILTPYVSRLNTTRSLNDVLAFYHGACVIDKDVRPSTVCVVCATARESPSCELCFSAELEAAALRYKSTSRRKKRLVYMLYYPWATRGRLAAACIVHRANEDLDSNRQQRNPNARISNRSARVSE